MREREYPLANLLTRSRSFCMHTMGLIGIPASWVSGKPFNHGVCASIRFHFLEKSTVIPVAAPLHTFFQTSCKSEKNRRAVMSCLSGCFLSGRSSAVFS